MGQGFFDPPSPGGEKNALVIKHSEQMFGLLLEIVCVCVCVCVCVSANVVSILVRHTVLRTIDVIFHDS